MVETAELLDALVHQSRHRLFELAVFDGCVVAFGARTCLFDLAGQLRQRGSVPHDVGQKDGRAALRRESQSELLANVYSCDNE